MSEQPTFAGLKGVGSAEGEMSEPTVERYIAALWKRVDERDNHETLRQALDAEIRKLVWTAQRMREAYYARCGKMIPIKAWDELLAAPLTEGEKEK